MGACGAIISALKGEKRLKNNINNINNIILSWAWRRAARSSLPWRKDKKEKGKTENERKFRPAWRRAARSSQRGGGGVEVGKRLGWGGYTLGLFLACNRSLSRLQQVYFDTCAQLVSCISAWARCCQCMRRWGGRPGRVNSGAFFFFSQLHGGKKKNAPLFTTTAYCRYGKFLLKITHSLPSLFLSPLALGKFVGKS